MMKAIFLCLIPVKLFCQDVTGLWTGSMYNDTTKGIIPYEIVISKSDGPLTGYSHTTFTIDGIQNIGVKTIRIIQKNGKYFIEDVKLIFNNYSIPPAKGVHMFSLLEYHENDSMQELSGIWNTNRTKEYSHVTGSLVLHKQKKSTDSKLIKQLVKLNLLSSVALPKDALQPDLHQAIKKPLLSVPFIPKNIAPAAALALRKIETIETVFIKSDSLILTLYDNGEVDGDTVTILMNGQVIWARQGLTERGINKVIKIPAELDSVQLIMYAENLGSIPPNTGLLVVRDGSSNYEIRFSGDLQKNAAIVLKRKRLSKK